MYQSSISSFFRLKNCLGELTAGNASGVSNPINNLINHMNASSTKTGIKQEVTSRTAAASMKLFTMVFSFSGIPLIEFFTLSALFSTLSIKPVSQFSSASLSVSVALSFELISSNVCCAAVRVVSIDDWYVDSILLDTKTLAGTRKKIARPNASILLATFLHLSLLISTYKM